MSRSRARPLLAGLLISLVGLSPLAGGRQRLDAAPLAVATALTVPVLSSGDLYRIPPTGARHD